MAESALAAKSSHSQAQFTMLSQPINMSVYASMYIINSVHGVLVLTPSVLCHG